jgi:hypothetical protein
MNYSYEEPKDEAHCISFWGPEARGMSYQDGPYARVLKQEIWDWLDEHKDLVISTMGGQMDEDGQIVFTIRFRTKDAAMLFKLRFQGTDLT